MDTVSPSERSRIMARVKSSGNKSTEVAVISLLRTFRVSGWRRHYPLDGKPDFVFPQKRIVLFIDGCLWHGCPKHCRIPHTNRKYWVGKIAANKRRDVAVRRRLRIQGWIVFRLWEHDIGTQVALSMMSGIKKAHPTTRRSVLLACGARSNAHRERWITKKTELTTMMSLHTVYYRRLHKEMI